MEMDNEVEGNTGSMYTAKFWEYDSRLGRRWNQDPKYTASISRYSCLNNNPIVYIDPQGDYSKVGAWIRSVFTKDAGEIYQSGDEWGFNVLTRDSEGKATGYYSMFGNTYGKASDLTGVLKHSLNKHTDYVTITGGALDKIKNDPDMIRYQNQLIEKYKKRYLDNPEPITETQEPELITFGGFTAEPLNPWNDDTKKVASNELTWITRHAYVTATVDVQKNGVMNISYLLTDKLDLMPGHDKSPEYNAVTSIIGPLYHGMLGGKACGINAQWKTKINLNE